MTTDLDFMNRAFELARLGEGLTRPNPPVGAVLVEEGKILSEGWHRKAGEDHAERACLKKVEGQFNNATLYVTLEPCSTHGRTPPCTDIILEKGVGRVVVSVLDPNKKHKGRGVDLLEAAGVEVVRGVGQVEGDRLIAPFASLMERKRPFVTLKLASTLDGRIADSQGRSKWITGSQARERVQAMRRRADAIMVGAGTVRADNPSLLPRPNEGREPYRIIVGNKIPASSKVLSDEAADRTRVMSGEILDILRRLAEAGIMHLFCEGGGTLAASLIEARLVDECAFFIAPCLLGADGMPNFAQTGLSIDQVHRLQFKSVELVGEDLLMIATLKDSSSSIVA